ncbi:prolipoprotein diacylglyceryl transferase [Ruminococcaceae bacterium OttesenSCG-928-D13]|nr:prolipoprotein diacylglyceryl transferase [Ruminococcaceae bacterium OttesenSCG-928-D13]
MTNLVEFPGLGLEFKVSRVAFYIGDIAIYWYGVLIGLGMLIALVTAFRLAPRFGVDVDRMIDVIMIGFVLAIVCGRLYYVLFVDTQYRSFFELIDLRSGGIAIYGGIIGAVVGAVIGCKWRKVPLAPMLDLVGIGFLIGQALGRWGNFTNQEAFGSNTTSVFGMISPATTAYLQYNEADLIAKGIYVDPTMPVHPTFLYESLWCLLGYILLLVYHKHRKFNGEIFLMYVFWYGAARSVIEGLRTDPLMVGSFRVSQVLAIVSAAAALAVWAVLRHRHRGQPLEVPVIPPHTAKVRLETADGPTTVVISWPADEKAPTAEERRELARKVLAAAKDQTEEPAAEDSEKTPTPEGEPHADTPAAEADGTDTDASRDEADSGEVASTGAAEETSEDSGNDDENRGDDDA